MQPFASVPITVNTALAVGINATPFKTPLDQVYELAPLAYILVVCPKHTDGFEIPVVIIGNEFTVTETTATFVLEHPEIL